MDISGTKLQVQVAEQEAAIRHVTALLSGTVHGILRRQDPAEGSECRVYSQADHNEMLHKMHLHAEIRNADRAKAVQHEEHHALAQELADAKAHLWKLKVSTATPGNSLAANQAIKCSDEARHKQETYLRRVIHSMNTEAKLAKLAAHNWKSIIATVEGNTPYSACTGTVHGMLEHITHTETFLEDLIVLHQVAKDAVQADAMHAAAG